MEGRIKEICKSKGLRMADLAAKVGMTQSNLVASIKRNPKLSTLQDIAKALNVEIVELFHNHQSIPTPNSILVMGGKTYGVIPMSTIVNIPHYINVSVLRDTLTDFIKDSCGKELSDSLCGIFEARELFCLIYDGVNKKYLLSLCYENSKMFTFSYDILEYTNGTSLDYQLLIQDIFDDIEDAVK